MSSAGQALQNGVFTHLAANADLIASFRPNIASQLPLPYFSFEAMTSTRREDIEGLDSHALTFAIWAALQAQADADDLAGRLQAQLALPVPVTGYRIVHFTFVGRSVQTDSTLRLLRLDLDYRILTEKKAG
jgi:hypothetical protein